MLRIDSGDVMLYQHYPVSEGQIFSVSRKTYHDIVQHSYPPLSNIEVAVVTKDTSQNEEQMQCYVITEKKVGHGGLYADVL